MSTISSDGRLWLREARLEDAPDLLGIVQTAFEEYRGRLNPPSGAHAETEATIRRGLATERAVLAGIGSQAAGCVFFHIGADYTYLHRLAVLPAYRRIGLGSALTSYVETQARAAGSPQVRLGVRLQQQSNQALYTRLGYSVLSYKSHAGYTEPTYVTMAKEISEPPLRLIEVVPPDPIWPARYVAEAAILRLVFGDDLVAVHHVGSTSIPGIYAKPIIDIMPLVRDIGAVDNFNAILGTLGYVPYGEFGIPGRRYFPKGGNRRTHQLHIFEVDSPEVKRHLAFRDYLIAFPDKAQEYSNLKRQVAASFPYDINGYMDGKDSFIQAVEAQAVAWCRYQGVTW